jgi:NodT family efflux transporter outer membrane factor (OMF) lipoprotein
MRSWLECVYIRLKTLFSSPVELKRSTTMTGLTWGRVISAIYLACLAGCTFAPKYERPPMSIPMQYKEVGKWLKLNKQVNLETISQPWWNLYQDSVLNQLEEKIKISNENLKTAVAKYQEARAIAQAVYSQKYPTITGYGGATRQKSPASIINSQQPAPSLIYNIYLLGALLTYEIDAWGRVQNAVAASEHAARASEFDIATISLSMHAELASDYFNLRGADEAQHFLNKTVKAYQKALYLTQQRFKGGIAPISDVDQAITQLENAKTLATEMLLKRSKLEHAIAVLIGEIPGNFCLPPQRTLFKKVTIAPHLPSTLLTLRPDIAAAEEQVQSANARIGVAAAAFFPRFNLIGLMGQQSNKISKLFSAPAFFWSLGPPGYLYITQPEASVILFDGFKLQAQFDYAKARYVETVSQYRQTALTAFQEVEDALVSIHRIDQESQTQLLSTQAAERALFQARQRYKGGLVTFLDVVVTENQALQAELAFINMKTRRQLSSVQLIKSLGGGWRFCHVKPYQDETFRIRSNLFSKSDAG